jgi:hypothetical protein
MQAMQRILRYFLPMALIFLPCSCHSTLARNATRPEAQVDIERHDGQHDFDFEIGTWNTHLRRRLQPLTGSQHWIECDGTSTVRRIWDGRANLVELEADCPDGRFEGLNLRLYDPQSHQWSLNFASRSSGTFSQPTVGEFRNGRGEFFDQETLNGRTILVRFVVSNITPNSCRFEQSFSDNGGQTWEVNWTALDTRTVAGDRSRPPLERPSGQPSSGDFDFQIGAWKPHISRLQHPLTGSTTWMEYEGRTVVEQVWHGRANLVQLEANGPADQLEILCMRLYNPHTRQWSLNYANSRSGALSSPLAGKFRNGRGEFYGADQLDGKIVYVRNVVSDITPTSCHFEQAFSADGGKSWETNFWETSTRVTAESDKTH